MMKFKEIATLGLLGFTVANYTVIPHIEGYFFPVTGPLEISHPQSAPPPSYRLIWEASAEKLRECRPVRIEWYLGQRGEFNRVSIVAEFLDAPELQGVGLLEWDELYISLDESNTRANSFANRVHQCPWRTWETVTPFYN
jgi:hypothetical protein